MAFLPVPLTAVHTTNTAYLFGEGMMSRFIVLGGIPSISVINHAEMGRSISVVDAIRVETDIPSGVTGLTMGLFVWGGNLFASYGNFPNSNSIIRFLNASNVSQLDLRSDVTGALRVYRGNTLVGSLVSSLGTGGPGGVIFIEMSVEFHDTTGSLIVRVNNNVELNLTGIDTLDTTGPVTKFVFGNNASNIGTVVTRFAHGYVKDRAGSDVFYGRGISRYLPYGNDVSVQFTPTGAGANNNDRIKELDPDGDATRVSSSTNGHKDKYGAPNAAAVTGAVKCMWNYHGAKQDGSAKLRSVLDTQSGPEVVEPTGRLVPFGGYGGVATAYEQNPDTSGPWSGATISALDGIGFQLEVP